MAAAGVSRSASLDGFSDFALVGTPVQFAIHAYDESGTLISTGGGDAVLVTVRGSALGDEPAAEVVDRQDGTYIVTWQANSTGPYVVSATLNGRLVVGCPRICHVAEYAAPSLAIDGAGAASAVAGEAAAFIVRIVERPGHARIVRPSGWLVAELIPSEHARDSTEPTTASSEAVPVNVSPRGPTAFACEYRATHAGAYRLRLAAAGQPVEGAESDGGVRTVIVHAGAIHASRCEATLELPEEGVLRARQPLSLRISARDACGNACAVGAEERFDLGVRGPSELRFEADRGSAHAGDEQPALGHRLRLRATPVLGGAYSVSVLHAGAHVRGSPVQLSVRAPLVPLGCAVAQGDALRRMHAGAPARIALVALDDAGLPAEFPAGAHPSAWLAPASGSRHPPPLPPSEDWATETGSAGCSTPPSAAAGCTAASVERTAPGRFELELVAPLAGPHVLTVAEPSGAHLAGSPFRLTVLPAPADAAASRAQLSAARCRAGDRVWLTAHACDRLGNAWTIGGELGFAVHVRYAGEAGGEGAAAFRASRSNPRQANGSGPRAASPPATAVAMEDRHDGSYSAELTGVCVRAGVYDVECTLRGERVGGAGAARLTLQVAPGAPHAPRCWLAADGLRSAVAHARVGLTVHLRDAHGNVPDMGADDLAGSIAVRVDGPSPVVGLRARAEGAGSVRVEFAAQVSGRYAVRASVCGVLLAGSPVHAQVAPAAGGRGAAGRREPGEAVEAACDGADAGFDSPPSTRRVASAQPRPASAEAKPRVQLAAAARRTEPSQGGALATPRHTRPAPPARASSAAGVRTGATHVPASAAALSAHPTRSEVRLLSEAGARVGSAVRVRVSALDAHGAPCTAERGPPFRATLSGPAACAERELTEASARAGADDAPWAAEWELSFVPVLSGRYQLSVLGARGAHVLGSPMQIEVDPAAQLGAEAAVSGAGLARARAGEAARFQIGLGAGAAGARALRSRTGRSRVAAELRAPSGRIVPVAMHAEGRGGSVRAEYVATEAGAHSLRVGLASSAAPGGIGEPVGHSPYSVLVSPARVDPRESGAALLPAEGSSSGLPLAHAVAGTERRVRVRLLDRFGNACDPAEAGVAARIAGPADVPCELELGSARAGECQARFTPRAAGEYALHVTAAGGAHVHGSPIDLSVLPGKPHAASFTCAVTTRQPCVGATVTALVVPRDGCGNRTPSAGVEAVTARVRVPLTASKRVDVRSTFDARDGVHVLTFVTHAAGRYELRVSVDGAAVLEPPVAVDIHGSTSSSGTGTHQGISSPIRLRT